MTAPAVITVLDALRSDLIAAGWIAESPVTLDADADAERLAREERQS